jgi:hypothetical protein
MNSHEQAMPGTAMEILLVDDNADRLKIFDTGLARKANARRSAN